VQLKWRPNILSTVSRGNRVLVQGGIYHITDRCHNREYLLKFAKDREAYLSKAREALKQFKVSVLDFCITCNHVHLVIFGEDPEQISRFMHKVAGETAQNYNRRKGRSGAVWGDNYHAVLIDSGVYLERCIVYVELNMVRCGKVIRPQEWRWVGYHEIMEKKRRYRVVDLDLLCQMMGAVSLKDFQLHLEQRIEESIAQGRLVREPKWTESLAIGRPEFVASIGPQIQWRRKLETVEEDGNCILRESAPQYGTPPFRV
jgi:putative transposase